jgi:hypothetical protein
MIWQDIFFDRILNKDELLVAFSTIFKINPRTMILTSNIENIKLHEAINITCETFITSVNTEFPFKVSVYYYNGTAPEEITGVQSLCSILNCRALVTDEDSPDFSDMLLITCDKQIKQISIDINQYDNLTRYQV